MAIPPETDVTDMPTPRGSFRWLGLIAFLFGLCVYANGGGNSYSGRWAVVVSTAVGAVIYLEGLALRILGGIRQANH